jgi:hypothetical protein
MGSLTAAMLVAQEVQIDPAEEGRKVVTGMLITGLVFVAVIALGQLWDWAADRRARRRPRAY